MYKNQIDIELHYNFINNDNHSISFYTRNICSLAQVEIVSYIIKTLYPEEHFEVLSLVPSEGGFKDLTIVKFLNKNPGVIAITGIIFSALLFGSQQKANNTTIDLNTLEIIEKCKNLGADVSEIQKVKDICNSYYIRKQKNTFYETTIFDKNIINIEPAVKNNNKFFNKKILRNDFKYYIEEIPKEKEFLKTDLVGNIQLSQPFIAKQQQYGRGVAWKGIYYGDDVFDVNDDLIIEDGENVLFYMQDDDYKEKILNQEISFTSGDNIGVIFDISRYYNYTSGKFGNPMLYVKRVISHNDNLVQHKKDLALKKEKQKFTEENKNQRSLFNITEDNEESKR